MKHNFESKCWKEECSETSCYLCKSKDTLIASCIDHFDEYWESNIHEKYKLIDCREKSYCPDSKYSKAQLLFDSIQQLTNLKENLIKKITAQIEEMNSQLSKAIFEINKEILESKTNLKLILQNHDRNQYFTNYDNICFSKPLSFLQPLLKLNEIKKSIHDYSEKYDKNFLLFEEQKDIKILDLDNFNLESQRIKLNFEYERFTTFSMSNKNIGILAYDKKNQSHLYKYNWHKKSSKFLFSLNIVICSCLLYYDSCIYMIRGRSASKRDIYEQYDLKSKTKHILTTMNKSSFFHVCTCFIGKLLLTGYDLDMLYIYDTIIDNYLPILSLCKNKFKFLCQSNSYAYAIEGRGNIYESEDLFNWLKVGSTSIPNYDFIKSHSFYKNSIYFLQSNMILYEFDLKDKKNKRINQEKRANFYKTS